MKLNFIEKKAEYLIFKILRVKLSFNNNHNSGYNNLNLIIKNLYIINKYKEPLKFIENALFLIMQPVILTNKKMKHKHIQILKGVVLYKSLNNAIDLIINHIKFNFKEIFFIKFSKEIYNIYNKQSNLTLQHIEYLKQLKS